MLASVSGMICVRIVSRWMDSPSYLGYDDAYANVPESLDGTCRHQRLLYQPGLPCEFVFLV